MALRSQIPDKNLLTQVTQKLARSGSGSQSHITASVRSGDVTLTGTLRFEHERRAILRTAGSVNGVRRVIDQIRVEPTKKSWE